MSLWALGLWSCSTVRSRMILGQGSRDTSAYVTTTTEVENNGAKGGQEGVQGIGGQNSM